MDSSESDQIPHESHENFWTGAAPYIGVALADFVLVSIGFGLVLVLRWISG